MYKVVPGSSIVAQANPPMVQQQQQLHQQQSPVQNGSSNGTSKPLSSSTLLQQTLNNQHVTTSSISSSSVTAAKLNTQVTNQMNGKLDSSITPHAPAISFLTVFFKLIANQSKQATSQEQQAKNILCNWLRTCFQMDSTSEMSKTKLYPYYQQIAKINNWSVLTIPTFFEILK